MEKKIRKKMQMKKRNGMMKSRSVKITGKTAEAE